MVALPEHPPEWIESAPLVNTAERVVAASPAAVWAHVADHERWPEWFTAVSKVRVTNSIAEIGGTREVTMSGMTVGEVFTVWRPEQQFAFAVVRANRTLAGMAESVELEPEGDGTRVRYRQGIEPGRGFGWFWRWTLPRMRRSLSSALDRLAERAERDAAG